MVTEDLFIVADLDNTISPTGASDAVGGPICIGIGVIALLYSSAAN